MTGIRKAAIPAAAAVWIWLCPAAGATTWFDEQAACPVCQTVNTVAVIGSWGGYIYYWPSKFQFIFWPFTERQWLYTCGKCGLSCFPEEYRKMPADKMADVKKALEGAAPADTAVSKPADAAMSKRLAVAEKVYRALGKDDEFWCHFYRVAGYHLEEEAGQGDKADSALLGRAAEARKKALTLAERLAGFEAGRRKEFLLIAGAMRHFLKDDKGALADFEQARKLRYEGGNGEDPDATKRKDEYLSKVLDEYVARIQGKASTQPGTTTRRIQGGPSTQPATATRPG